MTSRATTLAVGFGLTLAACGHASQSSGPSASGSASPSPAPAGSGAPSSVASSIAPAAPAFGSLLGSSLPATTLSLRRERIIDVDSLPESAQDAVAAFYFCGGAPLPRLIMRQGSFYAQETLADALTDREALRASLACGAALRRSSHWEMTTLTLSGTGKRWREVRLLAGDVPRVFEEDAKPRPGIADVRCQAKTHDVCDDGGEAYARAFGAVVTGQLRDVAECGAPRATLASPLIHRLGGLAKRLATDGDLTVALPGADDLGPLELADDGGEVASRARSELMTALKAEDAVVGWSMKSDDLGRTEIVIDLPHGDVAKKVRPALDAYRKALASLSPEPESAGDVEAGFARAMSASVRRMLESAAVREVDGSLVLSGDIAPSAADRESIERYKSTRQTRYAALARAIDDALAGRPISDEDLRALGGEGLVAAVKARLSGLRAAPSETKGVTLDKLGGVVVPDGGKTIEEKDHAEITYEGGGERTVATFLGLARAAGFHVRVTGVSGQGIVGELSRGAESFHFAAIHLRPGATLMIDRT